MAKKQFTPRQRLDRANAYNARYTREHFRSYGFKFRADSEADIIAWLEKQSDKKNAVAGLIRASIASEGK